jgi:hypothetical protein
MKLTPHVMMAGVAATVVFASGCGSGPGSEYQGKPAAKIVPAQVRSGDEQILFPLKEGNQWTYSVDNQQSIGGQNSSGTAEITIRVAKVTPDAGGIRADLETVDRNGKVNQRQSWAVSAKGIYQLATGNPQVVYSPPQPAILFPFKTGDGFEWSGTGITPLRRNGTSTNKNRVLAAQEVDTDEGPISAIPVESSGTFEAKDDKGQAIKGMSVTTAYWAPNVGIVRYRQDLQFGNIRASQTLRLKAKVLK